MSQDYVDVSAGAHVQWEPPGTEIGYETATDGAITLGGDYVVAIYGDPDELRGLAHRILAALPAATDATCVTKDGRPNRNPHNARRRAWLASKET